MVDNPLRYRLKLVQTKVITAIYLLMIYFFMIPLPMFPTTIGQRTLFNVCITLALQVVVEIVCTVLKQVSRVTKWRCSSNAVSTAHPMRPLHRVQGRDLMM